MGHTIFTIAMCVFTAWYFWYFLPIIINAIKTGQIDGRTGIYYKKKHKIQYYILTSYCILSLLLLILAIYALLLG